MHKKQNHQPEEQPPDRSHSGAVVPRRTPQEVVLILPESEDDCCNSQGALKKRIPAPNAALAPANQLRKQFIGLGVCSCCCYEKQSAYSCLAPTEG